MSVRLPPLGFPARLPSPNAQVAGLPLPPRPRGKAGYGCFLAALVLGSILLGLIFLTRLSSKPMIAPAVFIPQVTTANAWDLPSRPWGQYYGESRQGGESHVARIVSATVSRTNPSRRPHLSVTIDPGVHTRLVVGVYALGRGEVGSFSSGYHSGPETSGSFAPVGRVITVSPEGQEGTQEVSLDIDFPSGDDVAGLQVSLFAEANVEVDRKLVVVPYQSPSRKW
jgi:hypothetical protein